MELNLPIAMYDYREVTIGQHKVTVQRVPCPQEPYGAQLADDAGEPITAWGKTPFDAVCALMLQQIEQVAVINQHSQILDQLIVDEIESWRDA